MDEHRRPRRSKRWQYAIGGAFVGGMMAVLIAMAFRGPSTIIVQSDNDCCCCQQNKCVSPTAPKLGLTPTPLKKGYVPALPPGEGSITQQGGTDSPCCSGPAPRTGGILPVWPWWNGGGGGGEKKNYNPSPQPEPTPIPEPGSVALIALALAAWRATC